jgi:DNA polymerase-1
MLIDARNALYRAIYAVKADKRYDIKYHYMTALLRQFNNWMNIYRPTSVNVFWDAPRNTVWRKSILNTYKDRTNSSYVDDISEDLRSTTIVAKELFSVLGVRQFERECMEADDMIYAAASILHPTNSIIISSDSDMAQIPFTFSSVKLYDPGKKQEVTVSQTNPVWQKALTGDKSDNIDGYRGIGPKKSKVLLESHKDLKEYLDENGATVFHRNLLLVDLSLCPKLILNKIYCHKRLARQVSFDEQSINHLIMKHKINGLLQEYHNLIIPFKILV